VQSSAIDNESRRYSLTGRVCTLEVFSESYLPILREYLSDPDVVRHVSSIDNRLEDILSWFKRQSSSGTDRVFAILRHSTVESGEPRRAFVGITALRTIDVRGTAAVSGTIIGAKRYWGEGIGYEAKLLQQGYAFETLALDWIYASIVDTNERSRRLLVRLGYERLPSRPDCIPCSGSNLGQVFYGLSRDKWIRLKETTVCTRSSLQSQCSSSQASEANQRSTGVQTIPG
jgi:RimJ/RimL family protein N-acetyltransferase